MVDIDIVRLLIFLSRPQISERDTGYASQLCERIEDWEAFIFLSSQKMSLPMVHRNLKILGIGEKYPKVISAMQSASYQLACSSLRIHAAQIEFHRTCANPIGIDPVYFKGPTLSARYYGDTGLRFYRDVDLLVKKAELETLVRHSISVGYRLYSATGFEVPCSNARDVRAILRYNPVVTLVSPNNVVIEVHREISKKSCLFNPEEVLRCADVIKFGGDDIRVMDTTTLFVYACYHNTRHTWSRLHWLSDLFAITAHESFDQAAVFRAADDLGLRPTVDACLEFMNLAISHTDWQDSSKISSGSQLLELCIRNFEGDFMQERKIRSSQGLLELPFSWMVSPAKKPRVILNNLIARLSPNYEQYVAFPLPDYLQWLYFLIRPYRRSFRYIKSQFQNSGSDA